MPTSPVDTRCGLLVGNLVGNQRSALYPTMRELNRDLALWTQRKYKKLRSHLRKAKHWIARISRRAPAALFAHWQMGRGVAP
jgi:RNA-directed DNA polymerase